MADNYRLLGNLEPLTTMNKKPTQWFERFDLFASTNNLLQAIPALTDQNAEERAALRKQNSMLLLTYVDGSMYSLIKSLSSPIHPKDKTIKQIETLVCDHIEPKPTKHTQRYIFGETRQKQNQTISEYVAELRLIAEDCDFEQNYETRLLDQFISGMSSSKVKQKLLCTADLTLQRAIEKAVADERAGKEAQIMSGNSASSSTYKVKFANSNSYRRGSGYKHSASKSENNTSSFKSNSVPKPNSVICSRCKLTGHYANKCKTRCFRCKAVGHTKKNCKQRGNQYRAHYTEGGEDEYDEEWTTSEGNVDNFPVTLPAIHQTSLVHTKHVSDLIEFDSCVCSECNSKHESKLHENSDDLSNLEDFNLGDLNIKSEICINHDKSECNAIECDIDPDHSLYCDFVESKQLMHVILNDKYKLPMEFDSGSQVSCCSVSALEGSGMGRSFLQNLAPTYRSLKVANGEETEVLGKLTVRVKFNRAVRDSLALYVVKGNFPCLMGMSWIKQFLGKDWLHQLLKNARAFPSDKDFLPSSSLVCTVSDSSKFVTSSVSKCDFSSKSQLISKDCPFSSSSVSSSGGSPDKDPVPEEEQITEIDQRLLSEESWLAKVSEGKLKITEDDIQRCLNHHCRKLYWRY